MKRILTIILVVFSGIVFGGNPDKTFEVDFSTSSIEAVKLSLRKDIKDRVTIEVLSSDRTQLIHREIVKKQEEFVKQYDFSSMKDDVYIISVTNGSYVYEKTLRIDENGIREEFGAAIRTKDNSSIEVQLDKDISKIRNITISDDQGEVIFQTGRVRKRGFDFDITALPKGFYTLAVNTPEAVVTKSIIKR